MRSGNIMSTLAIQNLEHRYDTFTLRVPSFQQVAGITLLLGENGAGKTTLLRLLAGRIQPRAGTILLDGREQKSFGTEWARVVNLIENPPRLPGNQTGARILAVYRDAFGAQWNRDMEAEWIDRLSVPASKKVSALSSGTLVKLAIVVAVACGAKLLLMDEPTAGLDPVARQRVFEAIEQFRDVHPAASVLMSTHLLEDATREPSRIVIMRSGRFVKCLDASDAQRLARSDPRDRLATLSPYFSPEASG